MTQPSATRFCASCSAPLSPGARFCHRCGAAAAGPAGRGRRERTAWVVAGIAILLAVLAVLWRGGGLRPSAPPNMANPGNPGPPSGLSTRAPDISAMSPRERFDRLFDRVIRAAEGGDSVTAQQFAPMALGAYGMLDSVDVDLRFHAALIDLAVGNFGVALARADTILAKSPGHLFAYVIRGEAADRQNRAEALSRSYRDFLAHNDAEIRAGRPEYAEHRPILDDFRTRAMAATGEK